MTIYEKYTELIEDAKRLRDISELNSHSYMRMTEAIQRMIKTQEILPEIYKTMNYVPYMNGIYENGTPGKNIKEN